MFPRRLAVITPVLAILLFGAGGSLLGPLLPIIARDFHQDMATVSLLLGIMFAGSICAVMVGGYLADRFGKKPLFIISLTGLVGAYLLLMLAPSFAVVVVAVLLSGAVGGSVEGLSSAVIADVDPPRVARNINLLQIAFNVGAVLALLVTAGVQTHGENWRMPYGIIVAAGTVALLGGCFMRVPPAPPDAPINLSIARMVIRDRFMLLLAAAIALYVGSEMSLAWWISPILDLQYGYQASTSVLAAGVFWFSMGVGRVISSACCRRYAGYTVLKTSILGGLLSYAVLLLPFGPWRLWVGVGLAGLTFSGIWPLIVGLGGARYPSYSGTSISVLVASGTLGGMIFPALIGYVINRLHLPLSLGLIIMAALFMLLGLLVWGNSPARFPRVIDGEV